MFENLVIAMIDETINEYYHNHCKLNVVDTNDYEFTTVRNTPYEQVYNFKCVVEIENDIYEYVYGQITSLGIELIKRVNVDFVEYMY